MATRKQLRAENRMRAGQSQKRRNSAQFLRRVARRRCGDEPLRGGFCCWPKSLEASLDEFLAKGMPLVGGAAYLFRKGLLDELFPELGCPDHKTSWALFDKKELARWYTTDGRLKHRRSIGGRHIGCRLERTRRRYQYQGVEWDG